METAVTSPRNQIIGKAFSNLRLFAPSHANQFINQGKIFKFDAGTDISTQLRLSGEEIVPQLQWLFEDLPQPEKKASEIAAVNVAKRDYQKKYMDYWNETASLTGSNRPVDAVITPMAPSPAVRPAKSGYIGYSSFVNVLDYTSIAIPITVVDKALDTVDTTYVPMNETDRSIHEDCELLYSSLSIKQCFVTFYCIFHSDNDEHVF